MNAEERVMRARIQLQKSKPFFAFLLMYANIREAEGSMAEKVRTLAADAKGNVYYNAEYVDTLTDEVLEAALCHEILHIALEHLYRGKEMEHHPILGNIAADMVVNDILVEDGFKLNHDWIVPYNHSYTLDYMDGSELTVENINEKPMEVIYDEIRRDSKGRDEGNTGDGSGGSGDATGGGEGEREGGIDGSGQFDTHITSPRDSMGEADKKANKEWKRKITEAAAYAKMRGELPAGLEERIDHILESKMNWKQHLNKYITSRIPYDYSYSRPSNRSISTGFYMPHITKNEQLDIVVAIDTSGSISQDELGMFLGEMIGIAKSFPQVSMRIIDCDSAIQSDRVVKNGNITKIREMTIKGRGGTSHVPVYEYVKSKYPNTKILINFTDGYTDFPERHNWKWDTLWVLTKDGCDENDIPFGEVIKQGRRK